MVKPDNCKILVPKFLVKNNIHQFLLLIEYQYFAPVCHRDCQLMTLKSQSVMQKDCPTLQ